MQKYKDDAIESLESDIERMQRRSRVFIGYTGAAAALHICKEAINNAIDECGKPNSVSPGQKVDIIYEQASDTITVKDDGRGMAHNMIEKIFTTMNTGSNISARQGKNVLGENGIGTVAICALSSNLEITSARGLPGQEGKTMTMCFKRGVKTHESVVDNPNGAHGLMVKFSPSKKWLGDGTSIPVSQLSQWVFDLQYQIAPKVKIRLTTYLEDGTAKINDYKYIGFDKIIKDKNNKLVSDVSYIETSGEFDENYDAQTSKKEFSARLAFGYVDVNEYLPYVGSFCNGSATIDNGSHLDAAYDAINKVVQSRTKASMSDKEKEKLDIKKEDVVLGLSVAVNLSTDSLSLFTGQIKSKMANDVIGSILKDSFVKKLEAFFDDNPQTIKRLIEIVKGNAKVRVESQKIRNSVVKESMSRWDQYDMKNFDPCTNRGKAYKEIFLVEGDSAKGTVKSARDPETQAVFAFRGMPKNIMNGSVYEAISGNKELVDLVKVLGCNMGPKFDITKLNYDKIIIMTDADVDGYGIRSMLCSFFMKVFPAIVREGRLYIADPPLYQIKLGKQTKYITSKKEYIQLSVNDMASKFNIIPIQNNPAGKVLKNFAEFYADARVYYDHLREYGVRYRFNPDVLEQIMFILSESDNISKANIDLHEYYPEMDYDKKTKVVSGVHDYKFMQIALTDSVLSEIEDDVDVLRRYGTHLILQDKKSGEKTTMRMSALLSALEASKLPIKHRYKGLGETDPDILYATSFNPETRSITNVNYSDYDASMKVFQMLRGKTSLDLYERKRLVEAFVIDPEDIDT